MTGWRRTGGISWRLIRRAFRRRGRAAGAARCAASGTCHGPGCASGRVCSASERVAARGLLAAQKGPVYNTGNSGGDGARPLEREEPMTKFEEIGRKLDHELERLRDVAESKLKPETRQKAAKTIRGISEKLSRLAADLESRAQGKES